MCPVFQAQFPNICSNCITDNGVKYLEFSLQSDNSSSDPRNRGEGWPKDRPTHLHFILYKEFKVAGFLKLPDVAGFF